MQRFVDGLDPAGDVVVFERTGGYERLLEACLAQRRSGVGGRAFPASDGVPACPRPQGQDRCDRCRGCCARSGRDRLDAGDLRCGRAADVTLHVLLARRRQLEAAVHAERCRLDVAALAAVRGSIERSIVHIEAELAAIDAEVSAHAAADQQFRRRCEVLCRQAGVADTTARTLLAELPELGRLTAKEAACLGALAPRVHESGTIKRRRGLAPGRATIKRALFYPALAAMRHDPDMPTSPGASGDAASRHGGHRRSHAQAAGPPQCALARRPGVRGICRRDTARHLSTAATATDAQAVKAGEAAPSGRLDRLRGCRKMLPGSDGLTSNTVDSATHHSAIARKVAPWLRDASRPGHERS